MSVDVECLTAEGTPAAYVIRGRGTPDTTTFPTPAELQLQVGYVGRRAGEVVEPHVHHPLERHLTGTMEALVVVAGACDLDIYDAQRNVVATTTARTGDVLLLVAGGHGLRMLEDTVLLEVKQGPYMGPHEKERF